MTTQAVPLYLSPTPDNVDLSEALTGLAALGQTPTPQQLDVARVLCALDDTGAPIYPEVGICIPRRSGKSSAIWAVAIGRCMSRDDYMVIVTAATGSALAKYAKGLNATLEKHCPDPKRTFFKGGGQVHWEWENGSQIWVVAPREESYRGDACDLLIFDEAQTHDPDKSDDLVAAAEPLTDTVEHAQLIVAGTAGAIRKGMLWGQLEVGRADPTRRGIVEYAADPGDDPESDEVLLRVHPGITSGLTTLDTISGRRKKMSLPSFAREYLGQWPEDGTSRAIPLDAWEATAADLPDRPARIAFGFEVSMYNDAAAIAVAWRDEHGTAYVEVVRHEQGTGWLQKAVADLTNKYSAKCGFDMVPSNVEVSNQLARLPKTRTRMVPHAMKDTAASQERLAREVLKGTLTHYTDDASLNTAAEAAIWRPGGRGGRFFGARNREDISPLIAAAQALWLYDQQREKQPLTVLVQTG